MAEREYQRLTWSHRRSGLAIVTVARASLWLAKDHLLCIETNGYTENYKRFYFRDIQAITLRRNSARMAWNIVLAVLAALLLLIGLITGGMIAIITFTVLAVLCLIPLLINQALGPTCTGQIRTAVQTENLPIGRVRRGRKILERIRPLIAEAQGQLAPEEIAPRMQALVASVSAAASAAATPEATRYIIDDLNLPPRIVS